MKRISINGVILVAVLVLGGITASTATARCAMSSQKVGNFKEKLKDGDCANESLFRTQLYILVEGKENAIGEGINCVEASGTAKGYSVDTCTGEESEGAKRWVKVNQPECDENGEEGDARVGAKETLRKEDDPLAVNIFAQMSQFLIEIQT